MSQMQSRRTGMARLPNQRYPLSRTALCRGCWMRTWQDDLKQTIMDETGCSSAAADLVMNKARHIFRQGNLRSYDKGFREGGMQRSAQPAPKDQTLENLYNSVHLNWHSYFWGYSISKNRKNWMPYFMIISRSSRLSEIIEKLTSLTWESNSPSLPREKKCRAHLSPQRRLEATATVAIEIFGFT